jgi:anti-anti-sigma factor
MNSVLTSTSDTSIIRISGDVDISNEDALKRIERDVAESPNVVLDVKDLGYVDTTFLRFLLRVKHQPNKGTRESLTIRHPGPQLRRIFEITGLIKVFTVDGGRSEKVQHRR